MQVEKEMCDYIVKVLILEAAAECLHLSRLQRKDGSMFWDAIPSFNYHWTKQFHIHDKRLYK